MLSDEQIAEYCKQGDKQSFEELVARYHAPLYNYILGYTANRETAEELVQETFIKMITCIDKYRHRPGSKFSSWLFTIARNTLTDEYRKRKAGAFVSMDDEDSSELPGQDDVETAVVDADEAAKLRKMIDRLPGDMRSLIYLRYFMDFSYTEIAEVMSYSSEKVKWRLHSAVERLRRMVAGKEVRTGEG